MIIVRLLGGLGNQMFQYSAGLALALKHRVPLKLDLAFLLDRTSQNGFVFRDYSLDLFAIRASTAKPPEIPLLNRRHGTGRIGLEIDKIRRRLLPQSGTEIPGRINQQFLQWGPSTYLEGFWQSPWYFEHCTEAIREDFAFREKMPPRISEFCARLQAIESICVHVRRGDFVGNRFHGTMPVEYYTKALSFIAPTCRRPRVFVFSDDIQWCQQHLTFPWETLFVDDSYTGPKCLHYFALMRACRAFVISNSSFSWWAAWLGGDQDKTVVAPKTWFLDSSVDTHDLTPRTWIRI